MGVGFGGKLTDCSSDKVSESSAVCWRRQAQYSLCGAASALRAPPFRPKPSGGAVVRAAGAAPLDFYWHPKEWYRWCEYGLGHWLVQLSLAPSVALHPTPPTLHPLLERGLYRHFSPPHSHIHCHNDSAHQYRHEFLAHSDASAK